MTRDWPVRPQRIAPIAEPDDAQAEVLAKTPTLPDGSLRNIFTTLAHQPTLLKRFNAFVGTFMRFSTVTAYEREVIVLRVAARAECRYEFGQHLPIAADAGISDDTVRALVDVPNLDGLTPADRLLAEVTDSVLATGAVDDALWVRLRQSYRDDQVIELLAMVGTYRMAADVLNVAGVELEPDMRAEVARWLDD